ncbi:MAG: MarR family transcriptional regulator, partial [Coriobacteriia bacterium]|nr:MarR family transcriptional regulator [Coriobacteriia bacterium]
GPINLPGMTVDENTPPAYRAYYAMRDAFRAQKNLLLRRLGDTDSHPGQALSLWALAHSDGITQSELADMLGIARPTVTTMLQKMERSGLVRRRVDEDDQRYTRIYVTEQGRALHAQLRTVHAEMVETALGGLAKEEQLELERLLRLVSENIERGMA